MKKKKPAVSAVPAIESQPVNLKRYYYILAILTFFVFANTIGNGYNLDDELVTRGHKLTSKGLEAVGDIFTSPYYSDDMGYAYGYRPMAHLSFAIEHQLFGEKAGVSHFISVLLYVLSILLFFKLLLKWAGEKGLAFALIATLLFSVHSVHTEVVASIKNRDEILAFLFVILSALSVEKLYEKGKWRFLVWAFVYFTLAMLSKKSVFPLAIVIPLVSLFLKQPDFRKTVFVSIALLIPAVLIGSELDVAKMPLMAGASIVLIGLACYIRHIQEKQIEMKAVFTDYRLAIAVSLALFAYAGLKHEILLSLVALLLLALPYRQNRQVILLLFLAQVLAAFFLFRSYEFLHFALIVAVYAAFESFFSGKRNWFFWTLVAISVVASALLVSFVGMVELSSIAACIIFCFLILRKWLFGAIFMLLCLVGGVFLVSQIPYYVFLVMLITLLSGIALYKKGLEVLFYVLIGGSVVIAAYNYKYSRLYFEQSQLTAVQQKLSEAERKAKQKEGNFLTEGRSLEAVENTLVLPHTQAETFGTGAATLGEYMRLMVFPAELSFYYGYARTQTVGLSNPWVWVSIAVHLLLIVLAFWQLKKRPLLSIGIAWYLLSILLFSNWLELVAGMVGERLAFTASAGFCIFIASLVLWIRPNFSFQKPGAAELVLILALLVFTGRTFVRNTDWKNYMTLMSHDIKHLNNSAQANNLYALNLMRSSVEDVDQTREMQLEKQKLAVVHFDRALQIWPEFFNAAYDKGRAAMAVQDTTAAIAGFEKAVEIGNSDFLDPYYQLGDLYIQKKMNKNFLALSKKIYQLSKNKPDGYSVLARGYFINGQADSSKIILNEGIQKFPNDPNLKLNLKMIADAQPQVER